MAEVFAMALATVLHPEMEGNVPFGRSGKNEKMGNSFKSIVDSE